MKTFLERVADVYLTRERDNLGRYCFVFPNKRSGTFFRHYLAENGKGHSFVMPDVQTVSEFVSSLSPLVEASRYEQLFILYNEYKKLSGEISEFDRFLFWGDMLISDFNDVDRYLVDPQRLFTNVRDLKEINSTYLTDEQLEIIRRFWGDDQPHRHITDFWTHVHQGATEDTGGKEGDHRSQEKFLRLWEILYPLFTGFKATLRRLGLSTSGMYYRNAVERLDPTADTSLAADRFIFVGFNVLSTSELKIFRHLQRRGIADFYWDYNSPAFNVPHNRATRFIASNASEFRSRYDIDEPELTEFPEINVIGVPSDVGQAKMAGEILDDWIDKKVIEDPRNAVNTAVVLPDESLFIPVMHSVPEKITALNVTMGLPLRATPVAAILRAVTSMQMRARLVQGRLHFFYDDLRQLLSQPIVRALAPSDCDNILDEIRKNRRFMIDAAALAEAYPRLAPIFAPVKESRTLTDAYHYLRRLLDCLLSSALAIAPADEIDREVPAGSSQDTDGHDAPPGDESNSDLCLRIHFLQTSVAALDTLYQAASSHRIEMRHNTFFHLFERALGGETVNFVGEPLSGLQVMGVLETRSLDFDNIVMLSMNERVFPRRQYTASFIPDTLRRGFGMATMDFQESIFAYYFYRLIARARHVTLLYDARRVGGKVSEMSRYLAQLLYVYNSRGNVSHSLGVYTGNFFEPRAIVIPKTQRIMERLQRFTIPEGDDVRWLSASALNTYFNCPLNFYLQYIEGYREESDVTEYMDSSTFGTVVHAVAQRLYEGMKRSETGAVVTSEALMSYLNPTDTRLRRLITEEINRHHRKLKGDDCRQELKGESLVLGKIIEKCMKDMLRYEAEANDVFTFLKAEEKMYVRYHVNDGLTINVKMVIDRIDRLSNGALRFIDYKTGSDATATPSVANTLEGGASHRDKAIFQLLFYANAYSQDKNYDGVIQPVVYSFRRMAVERSIAPIKVANRTIEDYREINDEFTTLLNDRISEIFDPTVPFMQTDDEKACKYCQFSNICGRFPKD